MLHVGVDHLAAELAHHAFQLLRPLLAGGHLGLEVRDIGIRRAAGIRAGHQDFAGLGLPEHAFVDEFPVVDQHAFILHHPAVGRHGAGRETAHVGMVPAGGDVEDDLVAVLLPHRGDHGDVGQVGAAVVGGVQHEDVALRHHRVLVDDRFHRGAHGPQMHRHVRGVGDQVPGRVEDGAGEVQPLLDRHGDGGVLQHRAHLLGDRHEEVVEHLQQHRIGLGAHGLGFGAGLDAVELDVVVLGDLRLPAVLDDDGGMGLHQHRGAGETVAGAHLLPLHVASVMPLAFRVEFRLQRRGEGGFLPRFGRVAGFGEVGGAADGFVGDRLDHQRLVARIEAETGAVGLGEGGAHVFLAPQRDLDGGVGALDLQQQDRVQGDVAVGDALGFHLHGDDH